MTDIEVALATAAVVVVIFLVALLTQRKQAMASVVAAPVVAAPTLMTPPPPLPGTMDADGLSVQITAFEGRFIGRLTSIEQKQAKTDHDVSNIRTALGALPSKDLVHRLEVQATKTDGHIEKIEAELRATARSLERIETILMQGGGRP